MIHLVVTKSQVFAKVVTSRCLTSSFRDGSLKVGRLHIDLMDRWCRLNAFGIIQLADRLCLNCVIHQIDNS